MRSTYRWLVSLFALIFISVQSGAIAHAAQYTDNPHEHNGMVCDLDAVAVDAESILPDVNPVDFTPVVHIEAHETDYVSATRLSPQGRAPPPRSPPTLF